MNRHEEIQSLFDKVIDSGYYHHLGMCESVSLARSDGILNDQEALLLLDTLHSYLVPNGYVWLYAALLANGLPHGSADRLAIYRNWENRPKLS